MEQERKVPVEAEAVAGAEEDTEGLNKALEEARTEAEANLAGWQRAQADFANYKRRIEQERQEQARLACTSLVIALLPTVDDFERALASVPEQEADHGWIDGFKLISRKLNAALESQGVSVIKALGEPFDPNLHEAVKIDRGKEGIIVAEVQKGYKMGDRVLRPSKVIIGNGEEEAAPGPETSKDERPEGE